MGFLWGLWKCSKVDCGDGCKLCEWSIKNLDQPQFAENKKVDKKKFLNVLEDMGELIKEWRLLKPRPGQRRKPRKGSLAFLQRYLPITVFKLRGWKQNRAFESLKGIEEEKLESSTH